MKSFVRKSRLYWWLLITFVKKNFKVLILSILSSFLLIIFLVNSLPIINDILFRHREKIGVVGTYTLDNLPEEIVSLISNPLITIDEKGELQPVLANTWEVKENNRIYTYHLKPNLLWNDGSPIKAEEIKLNLGGVKVKYIDDRTIQFELDKSLSVFPIYLTKPLLKNKTIGAAGRYNLQNIKKDKRGKIEIIRLIPNKKELPYRTYRFYNSEEDLITAYKKGEINIIKTTKKNLADQFINWKNTKIESDVNYAQILTIFFNNDNPLLATKEIRKALAYATPKFDDLGVAAKSPVPPYSWGYDDTIRSYPFNLDQAQALIDRNTDASSSGELNISTFYDYINVAEEIKNNYESLGLKINLQVLSYVPDDFDILVTMWNPPADPDQYIYWHSTQKPTNITKYRNVKVDKLLEDGRKIMKTSERQPIYSQFQEIIVDEVPAHFVYYPYVYTISRK